MMATETDADRRLFVHEDDFAVPISWIHAQGTVTFAAIFDDDYSLVASPFLDAGAEGSMPQILACAADIPVTGRQGDSVTVKSKTYTVAEIKPDGTGMTVVRLQEV